MKELKPAESLLSGERVAGISHIPLYIEKLGPCQKTSSQERGRDQSQEQPLSVSDPELKDVFFWAIRTQFVLHMRHIMSPLQSPAS
jgi:hypothetical protein